MKEIIMIFSYYGVGGAQRRAANIANYLCDKGYKITIVALLGSNDSIKNENYYQLKPEIRTVLLPDFIKETDNSEVKKCIEKEERKIVILKKISYFLQLFRIKSVKLNAVISRIKVSKELKAFLKTADKDSLILHFGFNIFKPVYYASKYFKMKLCYVETNAAEKYRSMCNYGEISALIKKSDAFIFQTHVEMQEHGIAEGKNVAVIPNPVAADLIEPYYGERRKIITNFSAMKPQKNFMLLIKAFELILKEFQEYKLYLYADSDGAHNGEYYNELMNYIVCNGLTENVKIFYMRQDVHEIVKDCAMFVMSSDYEGISNSMLEAMAIGLPTICTDCAGGGAREIIEDGVNGLLVPVGEEKPLYEAMKCFIVNKSFANECGKNAAKIRNYFSDEKVYAKWLEFIERIIA